MKYALNFLICVSIILSVTSCNGNPGEKNSESPTTKASEPLSVMNTSSTAQSKAESEEVVEVEVGTVEEFFEAIAPNRIIKLKGKTFKLDELSGTAKTNQYAYLQSNGEELVIHDLQNLSIIGLGDGMVEVFTKYMEADVLRFENVKNVNISNVRMGHWPDAGGCEGGVLVFKNASDIVIDRCDIFGCGMNGLEASAVKNLLFKNSMIEDCKFHIMCIGNSENVTFLNSVFKNNRGGELINISGCKDVLFEKCDISNNVGITDIGVLFNIDLGFSGYVDSFERNDVISNIHFKDSDFKGNSTVSESMARAADESGDSLTFENVVFEGNSFVKP
jgi:hypothetical protein